MGFYGDRILPGLIHWSMRNRQLTSYRRRALQDAQGRVLEIGVGSGLNLPYYGARVAELLALEPSARLLAMARRSAGELRIPVTAMAGSAEAIPLGSGSLDTVVSTWTLCSIPDVSRALREVRRVLKPDGRLLFVEHDLAPAPGVRAWQQRLTPTWKVLGGGCHLDRPIDALIERAGFALDPLRRGYAVGPKAAAFFYEGVARPA